MQAGHPTILTGCPLIGNLGNKWTSQHYLFKYGDQTRPMTALRANNKTSEGKKLFTLRDRSQPDGTYNPGKFNVSEDDVFGIHSTIPAFFTKAENTYIQDWITQNGALPVKAAIELGKTITADIEAEISTKTIKKIQEILEMWKDNKAGECCDMSPARFYLGDTGTATPMHYSIDHTLHANMFGSKKFYLFSAEDWTSLYVNPVLHPFDRGSQITDIFNTKLIKKNFPKFKNVKGERAIVEAGEVLFIPRMTFRHAEHDAKSSGASMGISWTGNRFGGTQESVVNSAPIMKRVFWSRIIETTVAEKMGPTESIEFFKALDRGSGVLPANLDKKASKKQKEMVKEMEKQLPTMGILHEGESTTVFLEWLTKGRFDALPVYEEVWGTTAEKVQMHKTESVTKFQQWLQEEKTQVQMKAARKSYETEARKQIKKEGGDPDKVFPEAIDGKGGGAASPPREPCNAVDGEHKYCDAKEKEYLSMWKDKPAVDISAEYKRLAKLSDDEQKFIKLERKYIKREKAVSILKQLVSGDGPGEEGKTEL
jgi:hypothetical protein